MSHLVALAVETLTAAAFAAYGEVIAADAARAVYPINDGTTQRFHDLISIDTALAEGRPLLSLFRAQPRALPLQLTVLERHPLGSQAFVPRDPRTRYLVVVAEQADARPRVFFADQGQGVNYRRGTWHHPLLALDAESEFWVIDRGGDGDNCDEVDVSGRWLVRSADVA